MKIRKPTVDTPVTILVCLADHLVNLLIRQFLADRGHDVTQLSGRDEAIVIAVENLERSVKKNPRNVARPLANLECLSDFLLRVGVLHLPGHHGQKL